MHCCRHLRQPNFCKEYVVLLTNELSLRVDENVTPTCAVVAALVSDLVDLYQPHGLPYSVHYYARLPHDRDSPYTYFLFLLGVRPTLSIPSTHSQFYHLLSEG